MNYCSKYTVVNNMTKRRIGHCNHNPFCIAQNCDCRIRPPNKATFSFPKTFLNGSTPTYTWNSNSNANPFVYNPDSGSHQQYEISIYGKNKTSFGSSCIPDTTITVQCTGILVGEFPTIPITTDDPDFTSADVSNVTVNMGEEGNPLQFYFYCPPNTQFCPNGYTGGSCSIVIEAQGEKTQTYDLLEEGIDGITWEWYGSGGWFSTVILTSPNQSDNCTVQLQCNWTLNNETSTGQTWMQMNAQVAYSNCYNCNGGTSNVATVAGKMTDITQL